METKRIGIGMYKECKTPQSTQRQIHIAQCLCEMMCKMPFDEISVSALCERADVPRKSFYRYFDTKEDVFNLLIDRTIIDCCEYIEYQWQPTSFITRDTLAKCFSFLRTRSRVMEAVTKNQLSITTISRAVAFINELFAKNNATLDDRESMVTLISVLVIYSMVVQWHHYSYSHSADEMADAAYNLLTKPLLNANPLDSLDNLPRVTLF